LAIILINHLIKCGILPLSCV